MQYPDCYRFASFDDALSGQDIATQRLPVIRQSALQPALSDDGSSGVAAKVAGCITFAKRAARLGRVRFELAQAKRIIGN